MCNQKAQSMIPVSASSYWMNLLAVSLFFASLFIFSNTFPAIGSLLLTTLSLLCTIIPLWLYDFCVLKVQNRSSTELSRQPGPIDRERLVIKLIGLYGTFLIILLIYLFVDRYYPLSALKKFFSFLDLVGPWILIVSFFYFSELDRRQTNPCDSYWHMGCLLTGQFSKVNSTFLKEHARVWFIKSFFTPFLLVILVNYVETLQSFKGAGQDFMFWHSFGLDLLYLIDVLYGVLGYILTCRLFDTHIRSTDPTFLGWLVCLMCYEPFAKNFGIGLFHYEDGFYWNDWFAFLPIYKYFYAGAILFFSLIYALATVAIGYRMSNLTYRGLITSGPYRFTKHPAYLCKVASWWLISLPFFSVEGPGVAVKYSLALGVISVIYYLRAKTEENHLANYPEYVEYAKWIDQHGIFKSFKKRFPALQFSEEKCKRWGSVVWFKRVRSKGNEAFL